MWDTIRGATPDRPRPAATLECEVSEDERHANRRTKRGRAAPDRQLGPNQRRILVWLLEEKRRIIGQALQAGDVDSGEIRDVLRSPEESAEWRRKAHQARRTLDTRGVPWKKVAAKLDIRPSSVTEALQALESPKRALVQVKRGRGRMATHVKLTPLGERRAIELMVEAEDIDGRLQAAFEKMHGPRYAWAPEREEAFERMRRKLIAERELPFWDLPPIHVEIRVRDSDER